MQSSKPNLVDQHKTQETALDRIRQIEIMDKFVAFLDNKVTYEMTGTGDTYDAKLFHEDKLVGIVEIKFRTIPASMYSTYTIDAKKIDKIAQIAQRENVDACLIVSWQGDVRCLVLPKATKKQGMYPTKLTKRRDRDELADITYEIPISSFQKIS